LSLSAPAGCLHAISLYNAHCYRVLLHTNFITFIERDCRLIIDISLAHAINSKWLASHHQQPAQS